MLQNTDNAVHCIWIFFATLYMNPFLCVFFKDLWNAFLCQKTLLVIFHVVKILQNIKLFTVVCVPFYQCEINEKQEVIMC